MSWFNINNISETDTPALIVYPDRVRQNILAAIAMAGGTDRLRPHIKTCKSEGAVRMMMEEGIYKFKCATIAEAELLATCGAKDVLLAYQPQGPKIRRLAALVEHFPATQFSCITDNVGDASSINAIFREKKARLKVYIDLNIGMNRTGIKPGEEAIDLYKFIIQSESLEHGGLHAYDGHIRDANPATLKEKCDEAFAPVARLIDRLKQDHIDVPAVIAGGSVSFPVHAKRPGVECSPGTFIYWDQNYLELCPDQPFLPAALVVSRVISRPSDATITTDLGHKSIASENDILHRVFFIESSELHPAGHSEEHLVLRDDTGKLQQGDVLYGIPWHVCPTIALYERALTVVNGEVVGEWPALARNRKINF